MMTVGQIAPELLHDLAIRHGVCVRPVLSRVTDTITGEEKVLPIPCGSTLTRKCPPCADRARWLRMHQCREGWHRDDETPADPDDLGDELGDDGDTDESDDETGDEADDRRVRSTRRRQDAPDLPRVPMEDRTVGTTFTAPNGKTYRPSMFVTLTLGSYGRVRPDGTPVDPGTYDYRRAALDALHFPKLVDRFWQNLRRSAGYKVQYFATVEAQKRLAPHLHTAIRGAIPRQVLRQVVAATYHQVWWPACDRPIFVGDRPAICAPAKSCGAGDQKDELPESGPNPNVRLTRDDRKSGSRSRAEKVWSSRQTQTWVDAITGRPVTVADRRLPVWDPQTAGYIDPATGRALPTWDQALDQLDADPAAQPAHVVKFGTQTDIQGILGGTDDAARSVRYLTKYLSKSIGETYDADEITTGQIAHLDRLHHHTRWLPCSPTCANWLRYGVQPKGATSGLQPGECRSKAHDREHLGLGGRRVLVSRQWTGKTLTGHRADRAEVVRQTLAAAGVDMEDQQQYAASTVDDQTGEPRYVWDKITPDDPRPSYARVLASSIAQRVAWRTQYETAKTAAGLSVDARVSAGPGP